MRPETIRLLVKATLLVSFLELALLRVISRLAMHVPRDVPGSDLFFAFFRFVSSSGIALYHLSYFLALVSLLAITWRGLHHTQKTVCAASRLILFLLIFIPFVEWKPANAPLSLVFDLAALGSLSLLSILFLRNAKGGIERSAAVLLGLAYLSYYYFKVSQTIFQLSGITATPPLVTETLSSGELFAAVNGFVLFLARPGLRFGNKKALILSSLLTMLFLSARFIDPYSVSILATWSLGLRLFLPFPVYALALWFFSYTVLDRLWHGENMGYGLALIGIAGFTVSLPHLVLKALVGLALLGPLPERPEQKG